jgi:hypothetical protein
MDDLAIAYWGRIRVARFMAMTRYAEIVSPQIRDKYDIFYIPTVILFDRGVEVMRWRLVIMEDVYCYDLNKFLAARRPAFPAGAAVQPGPVPNAPAPPTSSPGAATPPPVPFRTSSSPKG